MLSRRICIVAAKPVNVAKRPRRGPLYPNVVVLLGDPALPDQVKRAGEFSEEDFSTVEKMREVLSGMKQYSFTYWDNHPGLLKMLEEKRPDFVLNLCDEGYYNDPFKELHVTAMLEL